MTAPKCFWPSVIVIPASLKMSMARSFFPSFTMKQDFVAFGLYPRGGPCLQISSHKFLISCNFPPLTRSSAYVMCLAPLLFWFILLCRTDRPSAYVPIAMASPWVMPSSDLRSKSLATNNLGATSYVFFT